MKILQINKFHYLNGGSERHYFDLIKLLEEKGFNVSSFSTIDSRNTHSNYNNYYVNKFSLKSFNALNSLKIFNNKEANLKLEALINNEKPDIAHLHNVYYQISPNIINILKKHNIPVIMTLHDYKLICPNYKLFNQNKICTKCEGKQFYHCFTNKCVKNSYPKSLLAMLEAYYQKHISKAYDKIDVFIAPSQFMKKMCVTFGIPKEKIIVLNNFTEDSNTPFIKKNPSNNYLLYFGRLSKEKGLDFLINTISESINQLPLKIVGTGPLHKQYKTKIKELNAENKIKLIGPKYGNELKELIQDSKAIIIPSIWPENMPISLLEAMLFKKTVIASKIGGIPEIIKNGENGFMFEPNSKTELLSIINNLKNYDLNQIGNNARKKALSLNANDYITELIKIYKNYLNRTKHTNEEHK